MKETSHLNTYFGEKDSVNYERKPIYQKPSDLAMNIKIKNFNTYSNDKWDVNPYIFNYQNNDIL